MNIRHATESDIEPIVSLDHVAHVGEDRRQFIRESVGKGIAHVAEIDDQIIGYMVFAHTFFGQGFISVVYVHPDHRRNGIASSLFSYAEGICESERVFTSTNRSNRQMKKLLEALGYARSGLVDYLDPGDPEVFYSKQLRTPATPYFPNWNRETVLNEIERRCGVGDRDIASRILDWGELHFSRTFRGTGRQTGSITLALVMPREWYSVARIKTTGTVEVCFQHLGHRHPFTDPEMRMELLRRVNQIEGVNFPDHLIGSRPRIPLKVLGDEESMAKFFEAMEWVIGEIRGYWADEGSS